jgi:hypothetical protein
LTGKRYRGPIPLPGPENAEKVWAALLAFGLPLKRGRCGTMTHDYKRYGTTTLFAALNTLDGTVIGDMLSVSFATSARTAFAVGSSAAWTSWRRRVDGRQSLHGFRFPDHRVINQEVDPV